MAALDQNVIMTVHMSLSVRGALRNMTRRQLAGLFNHDDGRRMTAAEARDALLDALAAGKEVLPFGAPCEGFDYSGGGCPGHASEPDPDAPDCDDPQSDCHDCGEDTCVCTP